MTQAKAAQDADVEMAWDEGAEIVRGKPADKVTQDKAEVELPRESNMRLGDCFIIVRPCFISFGR